AVAWSLVLVLAAREFHEESELAEHWPDAAHLPHQPLQAGITLGRVLRQQLAGLLRQVEENRAGFEQRQRRAVRPVGVEDRRDLVVRVKQEKLGTELLIAFETDQMRLVGQ